MYTYSLKQGIRDGFLAPYKVVKVHIDRDVEGYRPEKGQLDRAGNEIEDRIYNTRDFDRALVLDERTKLVARKVTAFLKESGNRLPEGDRLLRRSGARRPHAPGPHQRERRPGGQEPPLRHAHHRQRPARTGGARQLHRPGIPSTPCWSPRRGCCRPASMCRPAGSSCSTARSAP